MSLAKDAKAWGYFIRKGSSTVRAKGADEQELLSLAATVPFDDRLNQHARLDDLSLLGRWPGDAFGCDNPLAHTW